MEESKLEKLLTELAGIINELQKLIDEKDKEEAKKVLTQIEQQLANKAQIDLDAVGENETRENVPAEDALEQTISNINGIIEATNGEEVIGNAIDAKKIELQEAKVAQHEAKNGNNETKKEELKGKVEDLSTEIGEIESDTQELEKVNQELQDVKEQIDEIFINGGEDEPNAEAKALQEKLIENAEKIQRNKHNQDFYGKLAADMTKGMTEEEIERYQKVSRKFKGTYERLVMLQKEANSLETEREELEKQAESLSGKDRNYKNRDYIDSLAEQKNLQQTISNLEQELAKEQEIRKNGNLDAQNIKENEVNIEKIQVELESSRKKLAEVEKVLSSYEQKTDKETNLEKLQRRRKELEEQRAALEGKLMTKAEETTATDRMDMGAEARRAGDNIFKTHAIKKELTDRNVSREDFVAFYEQGIEITREKIGKINEDAQAIRKEIDDIFVDKKSDVNLFEQAENAYNSENSKDAIPIYETIRKNMVATEKHNNVLETAEFLNQEITEENLDKFADVVGIYMEYANNRITEIQALMKDQRENLAIFNHQIKLIRDEQKALAIDQQAMQEEFEEKSKTEKELRAEQIIATMFGADSKLQEQWDKAIKRFYGNRTKAEEEFTYTDENGEKKIVKYETIKDYDEYKDDAFFLNLEDYKKNLELTTRYRESGNDPYSLTHEMIQAYEEAEAKEKGFGKQVIEDMIQDMEEYVTTFHGNVNEHALKYQNYKTAGSTLKAMKPVKGVSPANVKFANAAENTFRFFGIRPPKFTRVDEHGNEVRDIPGGLLTIATDALVVGAAGIAIAVGPIGMATWGIAYASKGIVTIGNQIAARIEMRKYGDEIKSNLPTPFKTTRTAKEVARKEYYRTHDKNNRFVAWFKAKSDKYIFRNRKEETEEAIVQARIEDSDKVIDARNATAIETAKRNVETAETNQEIRQENYRKVEQEKKANPTSKESQKDKFRKSLKQTQDMEKVVTEGETIAGTAVTVSQKSLAAQMKQDHRNRAWQAALTIAGRIGVGYVANEYVIQQGETTTKTSDVPKTDGTPITKDVTTPKPITQSSVDPNKTIGEYLTDGGGAANTYGATGAGTNAISGIDVDSVAVRFGNYEISVGEAGGFAQAGTHVHAVTETGTELSNMNADTFIQTLQTADPTNYAKYIETYGLEDASATEIMTNMVKNGELYLQSGGSGWNLVSADNIVEEVVGYESAQLGTEATTGVATEATTGTATEVITETIPGEVVKVFSPKEVLKSAAKGAAVGAGMATTEGLHEGAHQTQKALRGDFEETAPYFMKILREEQEKVNQARAKREEESQEQPKEDEER